MHHSSGMVAEKLSAQRRTKCPSKACVFTVLCCWQFVSLIVVVICGMVFLRPYLRVSRYRPATCKVESSFYTNQFLCSCGFSCESMYPCLVVHVSINATKQLHTMALYTDDLHQSMVNEEKYDKGQACSVHVCGQDEMENRRRVNDFHDQYGIRGEVFSCYYDPNSSEWGVVIRVDVAGMRVMHAMLWPAAIFLLGTLSCVIFCRRCRSHMRPEAPGNDLETPEKVQMESLTAACDIQVTSEDDKIDTSSSNGSGKTQTKSKHDKRDKSVKTKGNIEKATDSEKKPWL